MACIATLGGGYLLDVEAPPAGEGRIAELTKTIMGEINAGGIDASDLGVEIKKAKKGCLAGARCWRRSMWCAPRRIIRGSIGYADGNYDVSYLVTVKAPAI